MNKNLSENQEEGLKEKLNEKGEVVGYIFDSIKKEYDIYTLTL